MRRRDRRKRRKRGRRGRDRGRKHGRGLEHCLGRRFAASHQRTGNEHQRVGPRAIADAARRKAHARTHADERHRLLDLAHVLNRFTEHRSMRHGERCDAARVDRGTIAQERVVGGYAGLAWDAQNDGTRTIRRLQERI